MHVCKCEADIIPIGSLPQSVAKSNFDHLNLEDPMAHGVNYGNIQFTCQT